MQVLPLPNFSSDFPSDPPILRSFGQWDAGLKGNNGNRTALVLPSGVRILILESLHIVVLHFFRAHYLDAKSVTEFGVYMPRGNPMGCFVVKSPPTRADDRDNTPATPPGKGKILGLVV